MFLINTVPLGFHQNMGDYAKFLFTRFVSPYLKRGSKEVHILFDNPDLVMETPKLLEHLRRDATKAVSENHICLNTINGETPTPSKWRESVLCCRKCKRNLVIFLSQSLLQEAVRHLVPGQTFVTAGGTNTHAFTVSGGDTASQIAPQYCSNAEESDLRIWRHVTQGNFHRVKYIVYSPDTDVYHIGLKYICNTNSEVVVQITQLSSKETQYFHLQEFLSATANDPQLAPLPPQDTPKIFQTLYISTGCDYISFFSGLGKASFLQTFFLHSGFISGGTQQKKTRDSS